MCTRTTGFSSPKQSIKPRQGYEKRSRHIGQRSEVLTDSQPVLYSQHAIFQSYYTRQRMFNLSKVTYNTHTPLPTSFFTECLQRAAR